jgi:hypothetical protein
LPGLDPPRLGDQDLQLVYVDLWEADQHGREAVVVRLSEELPRVGGKEYLLIVQAGDPDRNDARVRHTRFLRADSL